MGVMTIFQLVQRATAVPMVWPPLDLHIVQWYANHVLQDHFNCCTTHLSLPLCCVYVVDLNPSSTYMPFFFWGI